MDSNAKYESITQEGSLIAENKIQSNETIMEVDIQKEKSKDSLNILFHISNVDPDVINHKDKFVLRVKKQLGLLDKLTEVEFEIVVNKIRLCCLKHIKDMHELHLKRSYAIEVINELITRMDVNYIKVNHVVHLIWSLISCLHHFQLRFRTGTSSLIAWTRKKKVQKCIDTYIKLINVLPQISYRLVLNSLVMFYKKGKLWTMEFQFAEMICQLLYLYGDVEEAIEDFLTTAELSSMESDIESRKLIDVLSEILEMIKWKYISDKMMKRFLTMLRKSISPKLRGTFRYGSMQKGLDICLRNIMNNLCNSDLMRLLVTIIKMIIYYEMEDDLLLEFGSIGEHAALRYHTQKFSTSVPEELMETIMTLMLSKNPYYHMFGYRIIQNITDRRFNKLEFETPRIYFKGVQYNIRKARYSTRDRQFYKKYHLHIYSTLMAGLKQHANRKNNLENMYTYLAIMCVEIPCSYVASSIVSFAMAMQEYALKENFLSMVASHHVHAIVMSLMSLVCYVHKADVFYNYVSLIMERRSEWAPHLNPPMKIVYEYAQHHILWNQPDLFFEDWEARYGLWKCFRTVMQKKKGDDNLDHTNQVFI